MLPFSLSYRSDLARTVGIFVAGIAIVTTSATEALAARPRPRGPSPAQRKKMQEEMEYRQREMIRFQTETAAKEKEIVTRFDENGDGKLFGAEKSKYEAHLRDIRFGRAPNPFAEIKPPGQGPRDAKTGATKK